MNYIEAFEKFEKLIPESSAQSRQNYLDFFKTHGLPTRKNENWKFTSVKALSENTFTPTHELSSISSELWKKISEKEQSGIGYLYFVNGILTASPLRSTQVEGLEIQERTISEGKIENSFSALNGMFAVKECVVKIKKEISQPLHLVFLNNANGGPARMSHPRVHFQLDRRSSVTVIEHYLDLEDWIRSSEADDRKAPARSLTNVEMTFNLEEEAKFNLALVQSQNSMGYHFQNSRFSLRKNSHLNLLSVHSGSLLSRHNLKIELLEPGARADVLGLGLLSGRQHHDSFTEIEHKVGHCESRQLYKSILNEKSRFVFTGKIKIGANSPKASSEQLNKNLLLSSEAEADSQPQLEIETDDVKATHGSTVGQLSAEEIFYLSSRGLSRGKAIELLSFGFAREVVETWGQPQLQSWLAQEIRASFQKSAPVLKVLP